jgi:electron transfer flavoprotein alpha subunit
VTTSSVDSAQGEGNHAMAVVPVRAGTPGAGAAEVVAEAGGVVLLIGDETSQALDGLDVDVERALCCEAGVFAPARFARILAATDAVRRCSLVLLPASPDGRDLAPRVARALGHPLLAGAVRAGPDVVTVVRHGGRVAEDHRPCGPLVVTLEPGSRAVPPATAAPGSVEDVVLADDGEPTDARCIEVLGPDPTSMDLAEAPVIVAGGAGLGEADAFALLGRVAGALGASLGATRVVTDAGWVGHERQIGTTGVAVSPRIYVALGISGAVQHTGGLGRPDHVASINLDPSCPMMAMAELAVVSDAPAVLHALATRLGVAVGAGHDDRERARA